MSKRTIILIWVIVALAVIALVIVGGGLFLNNGNSGNGGNWINNSSNTKTGNNQPTPAPPPSSQPKTYNIEIRNFVFSPSALTINKGDKVTWTNMDSVMHTVTSDSGSELDSELLSKGESYSHTFDSKGTFEYNCSPHQNMKATIIVE